MLLAAGVTAAGGADASRGARAEIIYVASALASGNPTDALRPFNPSCSGYGKLKEYFASLTANFDVVSEVEINDEDPGEDTIVLKGNWSLQVADKASNTNSAGPRTSTGFTAKLNRRDGKWTIIEFSPIQMFNPQVAASQRAR